MNCMTKRQQQTYKVSHLFLEWPDNILECLILANKVEYT